MEMLKKNKILIILIILSIIKIVMCSYLPMFAIKNMTYDDDLMMNMAYSLSQNEWIGNYNYLILTKGMFFPLLLALSYNLNIPISIILSTLYILAAAFFCYVIKDVFKEKKWIYILYVLLLFNPISFSSETFERLYRNSITHTQLLFFLGFLYGIYKNSDSIKKMLPHLLGFGLTFVTIILNREDYIWFLPAIIIAYVIIIYKRKNINLVSLVVPFIIVIFSLNVVSTLNYNHYGLKITNELNESSFKKAYLEILKIKPEKYVYRVSVPKSSMDIALKNSETLNSVSEYIEPMYLISKEKDEEGIIDGYLIWNLKISILVKEHEANALKNEKFWENVYKELKQARESGMYETREVFPTIFVSPLTKENFTNFFKTLPKTVSYILTYDNMQTYSYDDLKNSNITDSCGYSEAEEKYDFYNQYTLILLNDIDKSANFIEPTYKGMAGIFNIITFIYKDLSLIINILGIISFVFLIIFKMRKKLFIPIITLVSFITLVCGVTYTHVSAFEAIRYFYLGPAYILLIIFSISSIALLVEGVKYEGINNINALFKRGRKFRSLYNKGKNIFKKK